MKKFFREQTANLSKHKQVLYIQTKQDGNIKTERCIIEKKGHKTVVVERKKSELIVFLLHSDIIVKRSFRNAFCNLLQQQFSKLPICYYITHS